MTQIRKKSIINDGHTFIVAEISSNHGQNFSRAARLIIEAKRCGADAVKFQAYNPESLTIDSRSRHFFIKHPQWGNQTLYHLYKKARTPLAWLERLKKIADSEGIEFFATAFDKDAIDLLEALRVKIHKIASFEIVDLALIRYAAQTRKPLILSTGMAHVSEIKDALQTARNAGAYDISLLKCTSAYPAREEEMNLATIADMKRRFKVKIGLSDHSLHNEASVTAVALGAQIIEKHFTLSRKLKTPDNFFSLEPKEFKNLIASIRRAEIAKGKISYGITKNERKSYIFRRSLFIVSDIKKGEQLTQDNVRSIRPGFGLKPKYLSVILGSRAKRNLKTGTPLQWKDILR